MERIGLTPREAACYKRLEARWRRVGIDLSVEKLNDGSWR